MVCKYSMNKANRGNEQTSFVFRVSEIEILSASEGKTIDHNSFVLKQYSSSNLRSHDFCNKYPLITFF
jgi:hypothetical protein